VTTINTAKNNDLLQILYALAAKLSKANLYIKKLYINFIYKRESGRKLTNISTVAGQNGRP
jgi:hypothetical protein